MPIRVRERPPKSYSVTRPRSIGDRARGGGGSGGPEQKQSFQKVAKQKSRDVGSHADFKAPSDGQSHQAKVAPRDAMNKSYADHFFQISKGHNNGSVDPHYHHKQNIDRNQYFPRPK